MVCVKDSMDAQSKGRRRGRSQHIAYAGQVRSDEIGIGEMAILHDCITEIRRTRRLPSRPWYFLQLGPRQRRSLEACIVRLLGLKSACEKSPSRPLAASRFARTRPAPGAVMSERLAFARIASAQVRLGQIGSRQVRPGQVRPAKIGTGQINLREVRTLQVGPAQVAAREDRTAQVGDTEVGPAHLCGPEVKPAQRAFGENGSLENGGS